MDDLKRMVTGIGLIVLATCLAVFGVVATFGPLLGVLGVVLWLRCVLVVLPGFFYFVTTPPGRDWPDAETKP